MYLFIAAFQHEFFTQKFFSEYYIISAFELLTNTVPWLVYRQGRMYYRRGHATNSDSELLSVTKDTLAVQMFRLHKGSGWPVHHAAASNMRRRNILDVFLVTLSSWLSIALNGSFMPFALVYMPSIQE